MKDLRHHRASLQKLVLREAKKEEANPNNARGAPKFRSSHEDLCWKEIDERRLFEAREREKERDEIRLLRGAHPRKHRGVLHY